MIGVLNILSYGNMYTIRNKAYMNNCDMDHILGIKIIVNIMGYVNEVTLQMGSLLWLLYRI